MDRRAFVLLAALSGALAASTAFAQASAYPNKPIRLVVPWAAGGSADVGSRLISRELQRALGQPVVVENKPGAGTAIAHAEVARAAPDGYTLVLGGNTTLSTPMLYKDVPYKVEQLTPVAMAYGLPLALVVSNTLPVNSVKEFVEYAKANPGKLNYGSSTVGGTQHMFAEEFKKMAGFEAMHIPLKGSPAITQEMTAGRVHFAFDGFAAALAQHKGGNTKILAAVSKERSSQVPDIPTLTELGYPLVSSSWFGFMAPAGTPHEVIEKLNAAIRNIMTTSDEVRTWLANSNSEPPPDYSPEEMGEFMKRDTEFWKRLIQTTGLQVN